MNKRSRAPPLKVSLVTALIVAILSVGFTGMIFSLSGIRYISDCPSVFIGISIAFAVVLSYKLFPLVKKFVKQKKVKEIDYES